MSSGRSRSGGTRHRDDVEPVEQVLAEAARRHLRLEVAVGGRHDAHVGACGSASRPRARTASPAGSAAAWPGAPGEISPISSRKSVPPSAASTRPGWSLTAPVKAPARVAEQLAGQQLVGEGRAVDDDEGPSAARRAARGERAPARPCRCRSRPAAAPRRRRPAAVCSTSRTARIARRGRLQRRPPAPPRRAAPPGRPGATASARRSPRALHHVADLRRGEGLGQVVARAALHRLDRGLEGRVGGDHHDVQSGPLGEQPGQEVEAALRAEPQVHEGEVERPVAERLRERPLRRPRPARRSHPPRGTPPAWSGCSSRRRRPGPGAAAGPSRRARRHYGVPGRPALARPGPRIPQCRPHGRRCRMPGRRLDLLEVVRADAVLAQQPVQALALHPGPLGRPGDVALRTRSGAPRRYSRETRSRACSTASR